jgi:hypothetical protein
MEKDLSGKMSFNKKGFIEIDVPNSIKGDNGWWYFNKCDARKGLENIWEENINYRFFRLLVNPFADKELSKLNRVKDDEDKLVGFDYNLKDEYLSVLNELQEEKTGKLSFACFNAVDKEGRGSKWWPLLECVNFPVNYIIKNVYSGTFKDLVNSLNDDKAYNLLKKREHPQNYNMNRIKILRKNKINPFVLEEGPVIDSDTLKNLTNFLLPFKLRYENNYHGIDDDL